VLSFIPDSTAMILTFGVNLLILVKGWQYMERKTRATSLFSLYTRYSSQRRRTESLIEANAATDDIHDALHATESLAQSFIEAAQDAGIQPDKVESAG
jgi:maltose-binding protein MalE